MGGPSAIKIPIADGGKSGKSGKAVTKGTKFRINRNKVGCTWSCPTDFVENPIKTNEEILEFVVKKYGECEYTIGTERHASGKLHFHGWFKFPYKLDEKNEKCFDVNGVHPNIIDPGKGWEAYCAKHKEFITNHYEICPYSQAASSETVKEAMDILWKKRPADCAKYGESIERNLRRRLNPAPEPVLYYGPFHDYLQGFNWSPYTHSLLLWGPPGNCKTQFARYLMSHMFGEYDYIKKSHEATKHLSKTKPFIFDEVYLIDKDPFISREITDIENGGEIDCRNNDVSIPPGLPRIFLSNYEFPFRDPMQSVYGRRVQSLGIKTLE